MSEGIVRNGKVGMNNKKRNRISIIVFTQRIVVVTTYRGVQVLLIVASNISAETAVPIPLPIVSEARTIVSRSTIQTKVISSSHNHGIRRIDGKYETVSNDDDDDDEQRSCSVFR